ncbi:MAG TPA: hypothetical protein VNK94_10460 [Gaiellaceae bacterium]|nr:hypothetical protein [Gaiellaceae bacterium]
MLRFLLAACAAVLLLLPVSAEGSSATRLRGVVSAKDVARSVVTVSSVRRDAILRVPSSALDRIRVGLRVELRGSLLRTRGRGPTRILARDVVLVRSEPRVQAGQDLDDDEIELKGTLTSLSPLTVSDGVRSATCSVPPGFSLAGFAVGDFVEITCDLRAGTWVLRELELEDDADAVRGDDDRSGPGRGDDDDDDDRSGPGRGDDDDDDRSGPGSGDDDDDDRSGPGRGDDREGAEG